MKTMGSPSRKSHARRLRSKIIVRDVSRLNNHNAMILTAVIVFNIY